MDRKGLTAAALLAALLTLCAVPVRVAAEGPVKPLSFDVELAPIGGSGVTGIAHLILRGERLTVLVRAFGFVPDQVIPMTIYGLGDDGSAECPPGIQTRDEPPRDPRSTEVDRSSAAGRRTLDPSPRTDLRGALISQQDYTVDIDRLMPLEGRTVILRSAEDGSGEPLACGRIAPYR